MADVVPVVPAAAHDPLVGAMAERGLPLVTVPVDAPVRTNYTLTAPDGTTTKLNEPGAPLSPDTRAALAQTLRLHATGARWVVLSGSLPTGTPTPWYAELVATLRDTGPGVAVDSSGAPLAAVLAGPETALPDLLKPNAEELAELATGLSDPATLESDPRLAAAAAQTLVDGRRRGGPGNPRIRRRGAGNRRREAGSPGVRRSTAKSTVGAGDPHLAGYLLADTAGAPRPDSACGRRWLMGQPPPPSRDPPSRPCPRPPRTPSP